MSDDDSFETLLSAAEDCLDDIEACLGDVDDVDDLDPDTLDAVQGDLETLTRVAQETVTLIETVDLSDLPEAIDAEELLEAIDTGEIPAAITDDETGVSDVIEFTHLFRAIDLLAAWDATELATIWRTKGEIDDAIDADDDEGLIDGEDGLLGGDDGVLDDVDAVDATKEALGKPDVAEDPEAYQIFIQEQAMRGLDAFREALLETNAKFERLYEFNREKMRRQDTSANSRNPTAASTIVTDRRDLGGGARHSTVPQQVKLSTAPSRKRIYGRRFEIERRKRSEKNE